MLSRLPIAFLLVLSLVLSSNALARSSSPEAVLSRSFPPPPVAARAAIVLDAANDTVLAAYHEHLRLTMASTTKLMTALLALELGNLSDRIRVPKSAFNFESDATIMGLKPGDLVTLRDLLYGLLLPSGADAADTIAIHFGGSEAHFAAMMNHEATVLGMRDTRYVDATGLSSGDHTSAYDLAILGQYLSYLKELIHITSTRYYHWDGHLLTNVNQILFWYPGVDGLKPGFTYDAGICQVIDARRDGRHVVVVVLNTPNLVVDARNLLNFGLHDFSWTQSPYAGTPSLVQTGADAYGGYAYFPASGHYLHGAFRTAFDADGGLDTLGFPRTEPLSEGQTTVQYFQNGALLKSAGGQIKRIALGLISFPNPPRAPTPTPTATPIPLPSLTSTPAEGIIIPIGPGLAATAQATPTPTPHATPTPRAHATVIARRPSPTPAMAPVSPYTATAAPFLGFEQKHRTLLGSAVGPLHWIKGYGLQVFAYGALAVDSRSHAIYLLPLGDRYLRSRHFLPDHPGDAYPEGFAPAAILSAIGWSTPPGQ